MTIIREFKITNLAGRGGVLNLFLDPEVNLIWGLNGTGKTTLLRILDAALSNTTTSLSELPFDTAEVRFYSERLDMDVTRSFDRMRPSSQPTLPFDHRNVEADLYLDDEIAMQLGQREADPGWTTTYERETPLEKSMSGRYKHGYLPISRMLDPESSDRFGAKESPEESFVRRVNTVWSRYSSKSLAEIRDIQQRGLAEVLAILFGGTGQPESEIQGASLDDSEQETNADDAYEIVSDFLKAQRILLPLGRSDFEKRYETSSVHRHVVTRIRSIMKQVDQVLAPQHELQAVIGEMYIGNKHLVLHRKGGLRDRVGVEIGDESIPISSLSSGEKQLLQMLLETLAVEKSTIMIDEPELSLHPDWQNGLVKSMRRVNPAAQFLLATHSPELMIGIADDCVFEL